MYGTVLSVNCMLKNACKLRNVHLAVPDIRYHLAPQVLSVMCVMTRNAAIAVLVVLSFEVASHSQSNPVVGNSSSQQQPKTNPKAATKAKPEPKGQMASLTGCIDEQEGLWVLVNDQTMAVIANLAADGFPTEGFAKHMGHKVTVRGTTNSGDSRPLFKVRSIETIRETCAARQ
jgi:hypothetical protein